MVRSLNIAVVGASWFADLWYLPVLQKHPNVNITAICSKTGINAQRLADKYEIKKVYTDYKEMCDNEKELDGVCIVTPNNLHKDITLAAIQKQVHIICEKPLALDAIEAEEMLKAAEQNKIVHAINFTYREHPAIQKMAVLVQEGLIGKIHQAHFEYSGDYGLGGPPGWRGTIASGGIGGVLQDLGSHLIDLAELILDQRITKVEGSLKFFENGYLRDIHEKETREQAADSVTFFASCDDGAEATLYTSWVEVQGNKKQTISIRLNGSNGSMQMVTSELGTYLRYVTKGGNWIDVPLYDLAVFDLAGEPSEEKFRPWRVTDQNEVWKWVDSILGLKDTRMATFEDGLHVQRVIDAVIQSAELKKEISM